MGAQAMNSTNQDQFLPWCDHMVRPHSRGYLTQLQSPQWGAALRLEQYQYLKALIVPLFSLRI
jgi:hypothetical protein